MMQQQITKVDAARRQLVTAIRLFFDNGDPVSIFTLAANSWEVIDTLCDRKGINSISNQTRENVPDNKDLKYDYINSPYRNFFKHADRDPEVQLGNFDQTKCDDIIFLGVEDYIRLCGKSPIEFQVFQLWYLSVKVEKVAGDALEKILETSESIFPNISNISREEQIALGSNALDNAASDIELLKDPRTEVSL